MAHDDVKPDSPSHTPGVSRGEDRHKGNKEERTGRKSGDATSIKSDKRKPSDPKMPEMPPA